VSARLFLTRERGVLNVPLYLLTLPLGFLEFLFNITTRFPMPPRTELTKGLVPGDAASHSGLIRGRTWKSLIANPVVVLIVCNKHSNEAYGICDDLLNHLDLLFRQNAFTLRKRVWRSNTTRQSCHEHPTARSGHSPPLVRCGAGRWTSLRAISQPSSRFAEATNDFDRLPTKRR
jgi:hypothetical protein